jgi:hypothetical protein
LYVTFGNINGGEYIMRSESKEEKTYKQKLTSRSRLMKIDYEQLARFDFEQDEMKQLKEIYALVRIQSEEVSQYGSSKFSPGGSSSLDNDVLSLDKRLASCRRELYSFFLKFHIKLKQIILDSRENAGTQADIRDLNNHLERVISDPFIEWNDKIKLQLFQKGIADGVKLLTGGYESGTIIKIVEQIHGKIKQALRGGADNIDELIIKYQQVMSREASKMLAVFRLSSQSSYRQEVNACISQMTINKPEQQSVVSRLVKRTEGEIATALALKEEIDFSSSPEVVQKRFLNAAKAYNTGERLASYSGPHLFAAAKSVQKSQSQYFRKADYQISDEDEGIIEIININLTDLNCSDVVCEYSNADKAIQQYGCYLKEERMSEAEQIKAIEDLQEEKGLGAAALDQGQKIKDICSGRRKQITGLIENQKIILDSARLKLQHNASGISMLARKVTTHPIIQPSQIVPFQ